MTTTTGPPISSNIQTNNSGHCLLLIKLHLQYNKHTHTIDNIKELFYHTENVGLFMTLWGFQIN